MENPAGPQVETQLADLRGVDLGKLRQVDRSALEPYLKILCSQVERPRFNLGSGPPGRVD